MAYRDFVRPAREDAMARHQGYAMAQPVISHRPLFREQQPAMEVVHIADVDGQRCAHCLAPLLTDRAIAAVSKKHGNAHVGYFEGVMVVCVDRDPAATWETGEIGNRAACGPWKR